MPPNPPIAPPKTATDKADPGPCPGPEFVKIKWLKAIGDEAVGAVEWCEHRRAAGLARDGHAETLEGP